MYVQYIMYYSVMVMRCMIAPFDFYGVCRGITKMSPCNYMNIILFEESCRTAFHIVYTVDIKIYKKKKPKKT
jgi:hypothetical protein